METFGQNFHSINQATQEDATKKKPFGKGLLNL